MPPVAALEFLCKAFPDRKVVPWREMTSAVACGFMLSEAMRPYPAVFSAELVATLRAAEGDGSLPDALRRIAPLPRDAAEDAPNELTAMVNAMLRDALQQRADRMQLGPPDDRRKVWPVRLGRDAAWQPYQELSEEMALVTDLRIRAMAGVPYWTPQFAPRTASVALPGGAMLQLRVSRPADRTLLVEILA
jgi:hypothetical protein